jgi:hypothetical protein
VARRHVVSGGLGGFNRPGHFPEPVVLGSVRSIGAGYECRIRLTDGILDEAILSLKEEI